LLTSKLEIVNQLTKIKGETLMPSTKNKEAFIAIQSFILKREKNIQNRRTIEKKMTEEQSTRNWTITQLHILSAVNDNPNELNNTSLAAELNISKPAVTKALNGLIEHNLIVASKKAENNKEIYYDVTAKGKLLAAEHEKLHKIIEQQYDELFNDFSEDEINVIIRFLHAWSELI